MPKEEEQRKRIASFAGSGGKRLWSTDRQVSQALGGHSYRARSRKTLTDQIRDAATAKDLREISINNKTNQGYADIINYYKTMYHYRYLVIPVKKGELKEKDNILETTRNMLNIVETINFEAILPHILETGLFEGRATIYLEKNKEGLVTHVLPNSHSRALLKSSYGTETVAFDLAYFDELLSKMGNENTDVLVEKLTSKERDRRREDERAALTIAILDYFPKMMKDAYLEYAELDAKGKKIRTKGVKGPQLINLPPELAAIIPFSPSSAPPKINVAAAEENYKEVLEVQGKKNKAGLEKIFTHKIPIGPDGDLLLTVDEAIDIQHSMEQYLGENADVTVVTTIGDTNLHEVQREPNERSRAVSEAYDSQYETASINPQLFRANTDYALGVSLNRDAAFMWDIIQKIINFYNIGVNNIFSFGDYSCEIKLLPITAYNEIEQVNEFRRMAEYGIGKLEAIIATGQKQVSLLDKLKLEKELGLDELLTPLQSSHTRSSKEQGEQAKKPVPEEKDESQEPQNDDAEEVKNEEED